MVKPNTLQELIALLPQELIHSVETVDSFSNDMFSFDDDRIDLPVAKFKNHCFSRAFLYYCSAYKKLTEKANVVLLNGSILFDFGMKKTIRISIIDELQYDTDVDLVQELRKYGYCRSGVDLGVKGGKATVEVMHHLDDVFNPAMYKNAKKRNQRLHQPLRVMDDFKVELRRLDETYLEEMKEFCDVWYEMKLEDPKIFQMLFSNPFGHFKLAIADDTYGEVYGYFIDGKMINLQMLGVDGLYAYSLYNVTIRNDIDPRINQGAYIHMMKTLHDRGIKHWNVGLALNPKLSAFKHRYPSEDVCFYHYGAIKEAK